MVENLNRKLENERKESTLEKRKIEDALSQSQLELKSHETELFDLRKKIEEYSEQLNRHVDPPPQLTNLLIGFRSYQSPVRHHPPKEREQAHPEGIRRGAEKDPVLQIMPQNAALFTRG